MASEDGAASGEEEAAALRALGADADADTNAAQVARATGIWFGGGDRYPSDSADAYLTIARDDIVTTAGFGFLTNAIVDQHFFRRKRHNRLLSVVLEHPDLLGVGIDESTALVADSLGQWSVIGASAAIAYDARGATITDPSRRTLGATGVRVDILPPGSLYDPASPARAALGAQSMRGER